MKVLLLNPPTKKMLVGNNPSWLDEVRGSNPCLGIGYIASYLLKHTNHRVKIFDCQAEMESQLQAELLFGNYDAVGITVSTFTLLDVVDIIAMIRRYSPKSKIIAGGTHPTIYPDETLGLGVDTVIQGEGEKSIIRAIEDSIPIITNPPIENLDELPFPVRTNIQKYNSVFSNSIATTVISSRGCPMNCLFCFRPAMGKKFRARSPQNVVNELIQCVKMGIKDFLFYDDTFTLDKKRALDIAQLIIKKGLSIRFDVRSRVNCVDKDLLKWLKKSGMVQIHFGIESGSQKVLDRIGKGITLQQVEQAFLWCKQLNIKTLGYIMIGSPDETREEIKETENFVHRVNPNYLHATIFTPFPATPLYNEWCKIYNKDVWKDFAEIPMENFIPPVWGQIPKEELAEILMNIYKRFYLRPQAIIPKLWNFKNWGKYLKAGKGLLNAK